MSAVYDERKSPLFATSSRGAGGLGEIVRLFAARLLAWRRFAVTYRKLEELDERQLIDIGLGRDEIELAAARACARVK